MRISAVNSVKLYTNTQLLKSQIRFGGAEDGELYSHVKASKKASLEAKWFAKKAQIEAYYNKQLDDLAKLADEVGMDNNYFWNQASKIRAEKANKLRQAKAFFGL